jgi:hypothetical protein
MVFCGFELQEESAEVYRGAYLEARCLGSTCWVYLQLQQQYCEDIADGKMLRIFHNFLY